MATIIIKSIPPAGKIKAIKAYRELTGADLAAGKAAMEAPLPITIENLDEATASQTADEFRDAGCDVEVGEDRPVSHPFSSAKTQQASVEQNETKVNSQSKGVESDEKSSTSSEGDIAFLPRTDILPILSEVESLSQTCYNLPIAKKAKEDTIAARQKICETLRNQVSSKTVILSWILIVASCAVYVVPGILMYFVVRPILYKKDLEKNREKNEQEASNYYKEQVVPLEGELQSINDQISELINSGKVDWAIDIVGEDIFYCRGVGDLINLISSRRADNLKEALNLYDSSKHRERMEDMQAGMLANSDTMAMESAKQTALQNKIEKNTRETATAAKWTAVNTRRTYSTIKRAEKDTKKNRR